MKRSTERILLTHTGSLPRPAALVPLVFARESGQAVDEAAFQAAVADAVRELVAKQRAAGVDIVNDGEASKVFYATYVQNRLTGFDGEASSQAAGGSSDQREFPEWIEWRARRFAAIGSTAGQMRRAACNGPIAYTEAGIEAVKTDIANLKAATADCGAEDVFMSAASPGVVAVFLENQYYPSHEAYMFAVAEAMKTEYDLIAQAGFVLQLDCPDLAMGRHSKWADKTFEEFREIAEINVAALNHALRDIPSEQLRMHVCWGNYEGPHHHDVPLKDVIDIILKAKPAGISFEASNPRHAHEWQIWEDIKLPDGKVLIPGVLDSTTNFIEHPELVAQRILNYARLVGRENVIAGTDCGFSTAAGAMNVVPSITWAKFSAAAEGARLASAKLW
ncbi:MAG: cobalamin-independent methionine synthase II family protein [Dehalococcoidia bacterium]|nr:cobalamin-independent methionine synthase II family protein [Dehalococcoidia bacterium]